ncbi:MAG: hypothetical protein WD040_04160 [Anaerolineales bacterium]
MRNALLLATSGLALAAGLACGGAPTNPAATAGPSPTPRPSVFDSGRTAYGFFPSPPEPVLESVLQTFQDMGEHADVVLVQQNIAWEDFLDSPDGDSQRMTDILNQQILARQNGLEVIFVVDPLNGLNRSEFAGVPEGWGAADFGLPEVRRAYTNFALRAVRELQPRYLGLASEINTYADAFPEDFTNFVSLYRETYAAVKAESPETQVFVTFQWEDLNNLIPGVSEGRTAYEVNWEQVEAFEPELDLWVISSYPFIAFPSGALITDDYYSPLLTRTDKRLAVAEGGFVSREAAPFSGTPQDQVDYLQAIHNQIGARLDFWIYLLLSDFNQETYAVHMRAEGASEADIETLSFFASVGLREFDGTPKPALEVWDGFRR